MVSLAAALSYIGLLSGLLYLIVRDGSRDEPED
jgi:hypothetical protein